MSEKRLVVLVAREQRDQIAGIAEKLGRVGMKIEQKLNKVGVITGSADESVVDALRKIDGVENLRDEGILHAI